MPGKRKKPLLKLVLSGVVAAKDDLGGMGARQPFGEAQPSKKTNWMPCRGRSELLKTTRRVNHKEPFEPGPAKKIGTRTPSDATAETVTTSDKQTRNESRFITLLDQVLDVFRSTMIRCSEEPVLTQFFSVPSGALFIRRSDG